MITLAEIAYLNFSELDKKHFLKSDIPRAVSLPQVYRHSQENKNASRDAGMNGGNSQSQDQDDWQSCSPASLRGHIANAHFQARTLADIGVARYDIEVASYRKIDLTWVVRKAYEKLEREDKDILTEIEEHEVAKKLTVDCYREMLIKNLKYIEQLDLAKVDWERVERSYTGASTVELDIERDGRDMSFFTYVVPFLTKHFRSAF